MCLIDAQVSYDCRGLRYLISIDLCVLLVGNPIQLEAQVI